MRKRAAMRNSRVNQSVQLAPIKGHHEIELNMVNSATTFPESVVQTADSQDVIGNARKQAREKKITIGKKQLMKSMITQSY